MYQAASIPCDAMTLENRLKNLAMTVVAALFVVLVPLFLIAFNVRWVINFPPLYSYGFDTYDIPQRTGIEREDLISAGKQIRDYFNNDEEWLFVRTVVRGVSVQSLYNRREVLHMRDVKGLVEGVYRVSEFSAAYLLFVTAVGIATLGRGFLPPLARMLRWGGGLTLGLVGLVGIGSLVGFERLFLIFHLVSFSNDLWQLDPRRDYLIAMFPQGFFFDATILIAVSIIVESIALMLVPKLLLNKASVAPNMDAAIAAQSTADVHISRQ